MKILNIILCFLILLNLGYDLQAEKENQTNENKYELKLKTGSFVPEELDVTMQKRSVDLEKHCFDSYYYAILQFNEIPTIEIRESLRSLDVQLGDYLPENSYLSKIPNLISITHLKKYNVRTVVFLEANQKISLKLKDSFNESSEKVDVFVSIDKYIPFGYFIQELSNVGLNLPIPLKENNYGVYLFSLNKYQLRSIAELPFVYFIEPKPNDPKPLMSSSSVQTRAKYLQEGLPGLTGTGVTIGIAEGAISVNHPDMKGRVSNQIGTSESNHASHVTGIAAGNGNINPDLIGQAPKSNILMLNVTGFNYGLVIYDEFVFNDNLNIINHSYGSDGYGIDGDYTKNSRYADNYYFFDNPDTAEVRSYLLNIYACGNFGNAPNHPGGWFTVVDGMNIAKNTLAVGALYATDSIASGSSRGPTRDGRLKPELMAEGSGVLSTLTNNSYGGITGTSQAAPAITGGAALLTEAYKNQFNGKLPKAALLKALMCNTADDLGEIGPDYKYGFGRANFRRAYECISPNEKFYDTGSLIVGGNENHTINITNDVKELNVTLYWVDPAAAPLSNPTLKNDLNLTIVDQSAKVHYPWLLDPTNPANAAITGDINNKDTINNIEKITIKNPPSGNWTVKIDGSVAQGTSQEYFVVYEFRKEGLDLNTPLGGESFEPGETIYVTWEAIGDYSKIQVEYKDLNDPVSNSDECGVSSTGGWNFIYAKINNENYCGNNLSSSHLFHKWKIPSTYCNTRVKFRLTGIKADGTSDVVESGPVNIIPAPDLSYYLKRTQNKIQLSWDPVVGVDLYEIYQLQETNSGAFEMQPLEINGNIAQSTNTTFLIDGIPNSTDSYWYTVKAIDNKDENGQLRSSPIVSERAYAVEVTDKDKTPILHINYLLEGAYDTISTQMSNALSYRGLLPGMMPRNNLVDPTPAGQPYNRPPWNFNEKKWNASGFNEVGCNSTKTDDVDWVLVTFREVLGVDDGTDSTVVAHKAVGMLDINGFIKFKRNSLFGKLDFAKSYYLIVEHRNHLPVMSHQPVSFLPNSTVMAYDFTTQDWDASDRLKQFSNGKWAAMSGNFVQYKSYNPENPKTDRNDINGVDKTMWSNENGIFDYYLDSDANLDGDVNGKDKAFWARNNGIFSEIPHCEVYAGTLRNDNSITTIQRYPNHPIYNDRPAKLKVKRNEDGVTRSGFSEIFILTIGSNYIIEEIKTFSSNHLVEFETLTPGLYSIHRFLYPSNLDISALQPGADLVLNAKSILNQGAICGDLDLEGIQFTVTERIN